jgi:hypothetical protein
MSWQDNSNNEDGFAIERTIGQSNAWQTVGTVGANVTTFTNTGLTPSTEYRYRVRSFNDVSSFTFYTNVQTVTTAMVPGAAPIAPSNLVGTLNVSFVNLTWSDNSNNEDKFLVQKIGYTGGWETEREVPANTTSAGVWVRSASSTQFRVVARNSAGGNSLASNDITIVTKPDAPYSVGAQAVSSSAIDIFWDSADSCQFHVERLIAGEWVRIASDVLNLSYRDTNLPPNTQQSYRVLSVAVNVAGDSEPSVVASATTFPGGGPTTTTPLARGALAVRWDNPFADRTTLSEDFGDLV